MCEREQQLPWMHVYAIIDIALIIWMTCSLHDYISKKGAKRMDKYGLAVWIFGILFCTVKINHKNKT